MDMERSLLGLFPDKYIQRNELPIIICAIYVMLSVTVWPAADISVTFPVTLLAVALR